MMSHVVGGWMGRGERREEETPLNSFVILNTDHGGHDDDADDALLSSSDLSCPLVPPFNLTTTNTVSASFNCKNTKLSRVESS